jgi:rod shape-determining protein MreC
VAFPRRSSNSPRSRFTLGLLILTAVTLLVLDLPGTGPLQPVRNGLVSAFNPIRSVGETVFSPVTNAWRGAFGYEDVKDENDRLRARLEEAKGDEFELERLREEVADLQRISGVVVESVRTATARVVSDPFNSFDPTFEIDLGSGAGVKEGMAVATGVTEGTGGGLFGRVIGVQGGRSTVELVTAPSFAAGVRLEGGARGSATGQGQGRPVLVEGISVDAEVAEGDLVYTSGITDSAFPPDLAVGRVSDVRDSANALSQTVEVDPLADLTSAYVRVVLKDPPQ